MVTCLQRGLGRPRSRGLLKRDRHDAGGLTRTVARFLVGGSVGQYFGIGRYVTSETVFLSLSGFLSGLAVGVLWRAAGRTCYGAAPFVVTVLFAAGLAGRFDRPGWYPMIAIGAVVTVLASAGAVRFLADPAIHWGWVAAAGLISVGGVWAGVPETGPALLVGGGLTGLVLMAALTRSRWVPAAGFGMVATLGWAALSGAADRPWAALGGALCTGVAPGFTLHWLFTGWHRSRGSRPWLLGAHLALVFLAARWIGADPHPGWVRVLIVAVAGGVVAMVHRPQA